MIQKLVNLVLSSLLVMQGSSGQEYEPDPALKCLPGYGLIELSNLRVHAAFCHQHAGRTCCGKEDTLAIRNQFAAVQQKGDVSRECLAVMQDAVCGACDPDVGTGVADGYCGNYCDKLHMACKDEFIDQYLDSTENLAFCRNDSLLCSKISEQVSTGAEFCALMGIPVSKHKSPTFRGDSDCFNGQSTLGTKYEALEMNPNLRYNEDAWDDGYSAEYDPYDLYYEDRDGDIFDRLGVNLFGGRGFVSSIAREAIMPAMKAARKFYRRRLRGVLHIFSYILCMAGLLLAYELFVNRKIHRPCMNMCKSKSKRRVGGMPDVAKEERLAYLEERMKNNKTERLKATAALIEKAKGENKKDDDNQSQSGDDSPSILTANKDNNVQNRKKGNKKNKK